MSSSHHDSRSEPARRTVLADGVSTAALTAVELPVTAPSAAAADAGPGLPASAQAHTKWQRYVQGLSSRTVRPVDVIASTGDVRAPEALLRPGAAATVLSRPRPEAAPRWPDGTRAEASSAHPDNTGNGGNPRTYDAGNAVDGDPDTFWNDDTIAAYPDTLTITLPSVQAIPGITVVSNSDGVPTDFNVETWQDASGGSPRR